jgi:hypothetical protein
MPSPAADSVSADRLLSPFHQTDWHLADFDSARIVNASNGRAIKVLDSPFSREIELLLQVRILPGDVQSHLSAIVKPRRKAAGDTRWLVSNPDALRLDRHAFKRVFQR